MTKLVTVGAYVCECVLARGPRPSGAGQEMGDVEGL